MSLNSCQFSFEKDVAILQRVDMFTHPDIPDGVGLIEFSLSEGTVFVTIDPDTDNLICSRNLLELAAPCTNPVSASFWEPIIGKALITAWEMINDRGYLDAVQLRFRTHPNEGPYSLIQLYGEASQIILSEVSEIRRVSMGHPNE